jgi:hypothetical protein
LSEQNLLLAGLRDDLAAHCVHLVGSDCPSRGRVDCIAGLKKWCDKGAIRYDVDSVTRTGAMRSREGTNQTIQRSKSEHHMVQLRECIRPLRRQTRKMFTFWKHGGSAVGVSASASSSDLRTITVLQSGAVAVQAAAAATTNGA